MSQKKVDQYKEYKKNRDKILAKEKRTKKIELTIAAVIAVLFIGWFGFSIYNSATRPAANEDGTAAATEVDFSDYMDYEGSLNAGY